MNCIDNYYSKRESNFSSDLPPKYSCSYQSKPPTGIKINFQSSYSAKRQEHQSRNSKFSSSSYEQNPSYPLTRSNTYSEGPSKTRYESPARAIASVSRYQSPAPQAPSPVYSRYQSPSLAVRSSPAPASNRYSSYHPPTTSSYTSYKIPTSENYTSYKTTSATDFVDYKIPSAPNCTSYKVPKITNYTSSPSYSTYQAPATTSYTPRLRQSSPAPTHTLNSYTVRSRQSSPAPILTLNSYNNPSTNYIRHTSPSPSGSRYTISPGPLQPSYSFKSLNEMRPPPSKPKELPPAPPRPLRRHYPLPPPSFTDAMVAVSKRLRNRSASPSPHYAELQIARRPSLVNAALGRETPTRESIRRELVGSTSSSYVYSSSRNL